MWEAGSRGKKEDEKEREIDSSRQLKKLSLNKYVPSTNVCFCIPLDFLCPAQSQEVTDLPCRGEDMGREQTGEVWGRMGRSHSEWNQGKGRTVLMCLSVETYQIQIIKDNEKEE